MSIHTCKSREKANRMGAYAGAPEVADLWELSKRELVELALRLSIAGPCAASDTPEDAAAAVRVELDALRRQGIV